MTEPLSISNAKNSTSSQILCCAFERSINIRIPTKVWKKRIEWIINEKSCRDHDGINGDPTEFEWNIFQGFTTLQFCGQVPDLLSNLREEPEFFPGRILFMSMFNDTFLLTGKATKNNVWQMPEFSMYLQRDLVLGNGHFWSRF